MTPNQYPAFFDLLMAVAFCFPNPVNLAYAAPQYFEDLRHFDLEVVTQAVQRARQVCHFFPLIADLREQAESIRRETAKAERQEQDQRKRLVERQDAKASGLSPAEIQTYLAEMFAVVGDTMSMDAVTSSAPTARPRELHPAYRTPIADNHNAARKEELRDQLAQLQHEKETMTHA